MNKHCKTCDMNCSGMCAKDWEPISDDDYKPEAAIQWLGVAIIFVLCLLLYVAFL